MNADQVANAPRPAKAGLLGFAEYTRRFVFPMWPWYAGGFVLLAAVNLVNLQIPQLAKTIINKLVNNADLGQTRGIALTIVGLGLLMIIIRSLSRIVVFWPGRRLETVTKSYLFGRTLHLPETFFATYGMGDLISRLSNDVSQLRAFYAFGLLQVLNLIFLTVFTVVRMASVHAMLTVLSLAPLLIMLVVTRFAMPRMHTYSRANQEALGALTNRVTEAFVNVHVIQANAALRAFVDRTEIENGEVYRTNMRMVFIRTIIFPLITCLAGMSQLVVLFYGGHEVIAGRLSVGDILAFNVYIGLLAFPLSAMGIILSLLQRARTALERIGVIDRAEPETAAPASATPLARAQPAALTPTPPTPPKVAVGSATVSRTAVPTAEPLLRVQGLTYRYPSLAEGQSATLSDISFSLAPGQRLGLFGKIGAGKSTLFQVLTRLLEPPAGTVFWQGQDVLTLAPQELRRDLGYALQQVHLFSTSIRSNLSFGTTPEPTLEALRAAARGAQILDEIEAFEAGWETEIGERGVRLSGGQKQRLALARLFLRAPPLLLLDDVLSAVDHHTEKRLLAHLDGTRSAMIIATHRPSALERCDEILILGGGRVLDRGTFADLVKRHPELETPV